MITTINAFIFVFVLWPLWVGLTLIKACYVFFENIVDAVKFYYSVVIQRYKYDTFDATDFLIEILGGISLIIINTGKTLDDFHPYFWEFAKYNHPYWAFFISCIASLIWISFWDNV